MTVLMKQNESCTLDDHMAGTKRAESGKHKTMGHDLGSLDTASVRLLQTL